MVAAVFAALRVAAMLAAAASPQSPAPLLAPGPQPVGFRSTWAFDDGRSYRTAFDDGKTYGAEKSPRPVLVLMWYPARASDDLAAPMPHRDYFEIGGGDAPGPLAAALAEFARGVFVEETMGKPRAQLSEAEVAELDALLAAPTNAHRDAVPATGRHPLVIYHSGAGSSFEDNAALCESLASHGYVVAGSAFLDAAGKSLAIDGDRGSAQDAMLLARFAHALDFVEARPVALIGHSAGAQAFLRLASHPGCVGDAIVLLDTTQDYYAPEMPLHESLVREASEGIANLTRPMLVCAGTGAIFATCDTFVNADRLYLTVPELGHNEYISQGMQRLARIERQSAAGTLPEADREDVARIAPVRAHYRALCDAVREFLDAELKHDAGAITARIDADAARPWNPDAPCIVRAPRGVDRPPPWSADGATPPTPRQFVRLITESGADAACAALTRFHGSAPNHPLYTSGMLTGSMLFRLATSGRMEEAKRYYATLKTIPLHALTLFDFLSDISTRQGKTDQAARLLRIACEIDPEDEKTADRRKKIEAIGGR